MRVNIEEKIYINPTVFRWPCFLESWTSTEKHRVKRSYDTLDHAVGLVEGNVGEFGVADAIMNLKRAINVRLKLLDHLHRFSDAASLKKMGSLERLEAVGLVRPFLIKQLFELRNDIEHNDVAPPSLSRVRELLDITWYFLRSTDSAAKIHTVTLLFENPDNLDDDSDLWLAVEPLSVERSLTRVRGWLATPFLSNQDGWEVSVERVEPPPADTSGHCQEYFEQHARRNSEHRYIVGTIDSQSGSLIQQWKQMFHPI